MCGEIYVYLHVFYSERRNIIYLMAGIVQVISIFLCRKSGKRTLDKWAEKSSVEGFSHFVVKRSYESTEVFIDLYWNIYQKEDPSNADTIYQRVSWERLTSMLETVENHDLPGTVAYLDKKRKRSRK